MVKFQTEALSDELRKPLEILGKRFGFCSHKEGRVLIGNKTSENLLTVSVKEQKVTITYNTLSHFLRGVGIAVRKEQEGIFTFSALNDVNFSFSGLMADCSRNGVLNMSYAKEMLERLSMMGHNVMMLYMEDIYEVDDEPYFGYLRGRYSKAELKELDDYAHMLGIELIPCIQTLAHMDQFLMWEEMAEKYLDIDNILYVGKPEVNHLLDRILGMFSETIRSKRIHLGMDEAYQLGRGRYANEHGLRPKPEIMTDHLKTVMELSHKHGLKPMIWDDMFFSSYSRANADEFSIPEGIDLMYWDYYNNFEAHYAENIALRSKISKHLMFAGGAWRWVGYAPHHSKTLAATNASLAACKKAGVTEVIATAWADDGCECPVSACLFGCVLFGEHTYHKEFHMEEFQKSLAFYTGLSYEVHMKQEEFDILPQFTDAQKTSTVTPSKYSFYEDPLCSIFVQHERALNEDVTAHYKALGQYFSNVALTEDNPALKAAHEFYGAFGKALSLKWNLGLKLYDAYQNHDEKALRQIVENQMKPLVGLVEEVRAARMKEWYLTNKSYGFEVLDIRMGGVKQRLSSAIYILEQYLDGKLDTIEALEEERLQAVHFREEGMGEILHFNRCLRGMTPAKMTW